MKTLISRTHLLLTINTRFLIGFKIPDAKQYLEATKDSEAISGSSEAISRGSEAISRGSDTSEAISRIRCIHHTGGLKYIIS